MQQALLQRFGLFTVQRNAGHIDVVRATVAITTTTEELDRLVAALAVLGARRAEPGRRFGGEHDGNPIRQNKFP